MVQKEQLSCPSCGKAVSTGQKFCNYCGTKFSEVLCPACGKAVKFGQKFCRSCGANIKDAIPTSNPQKISQLDSPETEIDFLKQTIENRDLQTTRDFLEKYLHQVSNSDETSRYKIYDLIGIIIKEDVEFFRHKIYSDFYYKGKKILNLELFKEMEVYLVKKYFLLDGEELMASSRGKVTFNVYRGFTQEPHEIQGRIFITNQRIIAFGENRYKYGSSVVWTQDGCGGIEFPYKAGIRFWKRDIDKVIPYYFNADEFPLSKASIRIDQIKRKKNRVKYTLKFDFVYNDKHRNSTEKLKFEPVEEIGEKKIDFQKRIELFQIKINEFMNSNISYNLEEGKI